MSYNLSPSTRRQFVDINGNPLVGGKLFYYVNETTTKASTYKTVDGSALNTNPVILDAEGRTPYCIYLDDNVIYTEVLTTATDTDPPTSPIYTENNISSLTIPDFLASASGAVLRTVNNKLSDVVSVKDFGAVGDGITDDAPAFRLAIASNREIFIPSGTYLLDSTVTAPPSAYDPPCVLFQSLSNFSVLAYGATLQVGNTAGRCGMFQFDQCKNFSFKGAKIIGSTSGDKNSAIAVSSCEDFQIGDLVISQMYADGGTALVGDWMINGLFENITCKTVSTVADNAYMKNVTFRNIHGFGADTNGDTGSGEVGSKGLSIVTDAPNISNNYTTYSFTQSEDVSYIGCYITNFATGAVIATGVGINFINCIFEKNTGTGSTPGIGIFIYYYPPGDFSSVGFPAKDIKIIGCQFKENGTLVNQGGIFFNSADIANTDFIENIAIVGCNFDNNETQGIGWIADASIRNIIVDGCTFSGANQTYGIAADLVPLINFIGSDQVNFSTTVFHQNSTFHKNNIALYWADSTGAQKVIMGVSAADTAYIRQPTAAGQVILQNYAGTTTLISDNDATDAIWILINGALRRIYAGAADSGGTGYRMLRVLN